VFTNFKWQNHIRNNMNGKIFIVGA